jgi:hypothetical protein
MILIKYSANKFLDVFASAIIKYGFEEKRKRRLDYKESSSVGEGLLTPLLAFALNSSSDFATDSSDTQPDMPETKLILPDAELSLLVLLGSSRLSPACPNSVLMPRKLKLL